MSDTLIRLQWQIERGNEKEKEILALAAPRKEPEITLSRQNSLRSNRLCYVFAVAPKNSRITMSQHSPESAKIQN